MSFWFSKGMSALDDVWGESFFFPHFVFTAGHADVPVSRSFGLRSLHAYAEDLGVFHLLSVHCALSLCTCGALPRWCLGPLCSCLHDCTFGNLKERHFVPFESCVL